MVLSLLVFIKRMSNSTDSTAETAVFLLLREEQSEFFKKRLARKGANLHGKASCF